MPFVSVSLFLYLSLCSCHTLPPSHPLSHYIIPHLTLPNSLSASLPQTAPVFVMPDTATQSHQQSQVSECTALYTIVLQCHVLYSGVLDFTAQNCTLLCCIAFTVPCWLHHTVLCSADRSVQHSTCVVLSFFVAQYFLLCSDVHAFCNVLGY